jgi:hypothetical protein
MKKIFIYTTLLLLLLLPVSMMGQCWLEQLATDLSTGSPTFKAYVKSNEGAFEAYEKLYLAKRTVLCKDAAALEAYSKASRNAKLKELGFTDEALASINSGADAQYAELLNNLDNLGNLAKSNNIAIEDIAGAVEILKGTNATARQALHNRIKAIIADAGGYSGKTVKLLNGAGRQSWNGFANIFKANADEILEATNKIKNHRIAQNAGTSGNYGYLEGKVGNINKNGEMIRSGAPDDNVTEVFEALHVNSQQVIQPGEVNGAWLRNTDSEYKMLNRLANELNAVKDGKYPNVTGELKIVSERAYCPSCQGVIQQFNEMFPNVKLILVDGAK